MTYTHIEGVTGREPVGAVLTIGKKASEKAPPTQTDRFFIVSPNEERGVRPAHPSFKRFNEAEAEVRQSIEGNLVHASVADAWIYHLRAQRLPGHPNAPGMKPTCTGDGNRATRFMGMNGEAEDWREIACPHRLCQYRQGSPAACRPFGRLYFRPNWPGGKLPAPLMKWTTTSWRSISNVVGFFDLVSTQAEQLGVIGPRPPGAPFNPACPVYGLPFQLTLTRKTQAQHGRSFPVVTLSLTDDFVAFLAFQAKQLEAIGGRLPLALPAGNTDPRELEPRAIAADVLTITPGIPARTDRVRLSDLGDQQ